MTIPRLMPTTMDSYQRYLTGSGNTKNVLSTSRSVDSTYMSKALSGQTLSASQRVAAQKEMSNLNASRLFSNASTAVDTSYIDKAVSGTKLSASQLAAAKSELKQLQASRVLNSATTSNNSWTADSSGNSVANATYLNKAAAGSSLSPSQQVAAQGELDRIQMNRLMGKATASYARWQPGSSTISTGSMEAAYLNKAVSGKSLSASEQKAAQSELTNGTRSLLLDMMA